MDIFPSKKPAKPKRKRKPVPPTPSWRTLLPWSETRRGKHAPDSQRVEDMMAALTGLPANAGREHDLFVDVFRNALENGALAIRVFELQGTAPDRVDGDIRLSSHARQRVRDLLRRGEARGSAKLPFGVVVFTDPKADPLQHGALHLDGRGFDLALVPDGIHRAPLAQWPEIEVGTLARSAEVPRGCPLVVGDCDARSAWKHLSGTGALAVFGADSPFLWLFKVAPGETFPDPFTLTELRRRAAGL